MKHILSIFILTVLAFSCGSNESKEQNEEQKDEPLTSYVAVSQRLLQNAKNGQSNAEILKILANAPEDTLTNELFDDDRKKAFWVNLYNGMIQEVLSKNPEKYDNRDTFFKDNQMKVSGDSLSFDDVEHGIIRNSKVKWGLGYIPNIFPGSYEKKFRTEEVDPRVHFILNCGAISCPPVHIFSAENFNAEADKIAKAYLASVSTYKPDEEKLYTTPLIQWFRGDFGEKDDDLFPMFYGYEIVPAGEMPKIEYVEYDWTMKLGNFY